MQSVGVLSAAHVPCGRTAARSSATTTAAAIPSAGALKGSLAGVSLLRPQGFNSRVQPPARRLQIEAAKKKKGGKQGAGGAQPKFKNSSPVKDGGAYSQETRKMILTLTKVKKVAPNGKDILKNVSLGMYLGAKIGVLGSNGAGKSTVMRILAGMDKDFDGECVLDDGIRVGYLAQEPPLDDGPTVLDNILPGVQEMKDMIEEFEGIGMKMAEPDADMDALMARMDKLQSAIDAANGWEMERQMEQAMDALRCPEKDALVETLSGGERRRVALVRLLLGSPDILLLDEPTNHLDAESVAWLEKFLAQFKGTVVAVTHDRYFLDNVAGWILELDRGQGIPFEGNYSEWLENKAKRLDGEKQKQSSLEKSIQSELEWVRSNAKGQQKKGKARMRQFEDLQADAARYVQNATIDQITTPVGPRLGDQVITAQNLKKAFGDKLLIDDLNFNIEPGSVVGIVGGNGAGKTTLFRMIMGEQEPDGGSLTIGETVKPMYVDQSRDSLDGDKTVYQEISGGSDEMELGGRTINARAYCSWFNFTGADQQKPVAALSGGERNRLQLAKVLRNSGNLLLLDEPTNDLDVDTLRALEEAIANFAGCTIVISHDRWFLDRLATHILAFEGDSQVVWFEGSYSEYDENYRARTGAKDPTSMKFRKLASA